MFTNKDFFMDGRQLELEKFFLALTKRNEKFVLFLLRS